jgi:hypothetical protein
VLTTGVDEDVMTEFEDASAEIFVEVSIGVVSGIDVEIVAELIVVFVEIFSELSIGLLTELSVGVITGVGVEVFVELSAEILIEFSIRDAPVFIIGLLPEEILAEFAEVLSILSAGVLAEGDRIVVSVFKVVSEEVFVELSILVDAIIVLDVFSI